MDTTLTDVDCLTDRAYLQKMYLRLGAQEARLFIVLTNSELIPSLNDAERKQTLEEGGIFTTDAEHDRLLHDHAIAKIMVEALEPLLTSDELAKCKRKIDEEFSSDDFFNRGCIVATNEEFARVRKEVEMEPPRVPPHGRLVRVYRTRTDAQG